MIKRISLLVSICLNVVLATLAAHLLKKTPTKSRPQVQASSSSVRGAASPREAVPFPAESSAPTIQIITNRFEWRSFEGTDDEQFVANLRAVGCPENTIRDIIAADLQRRYAARIAALPLASGFWSCGASRAAAERARQERERELNAEKGALLLHLLGTDGSEFEQDSSDELTEQAIVRFLMGPVPDGAPQRLIAAMQRGETRSQEIQDRAKGIMLPQDEALVRQNREQTLAEIRQILSPAQFDEFTRRMATANVLDRRFSDFAVTPTELREIARLRVEAAGGWGDFFGKSFLSSDEDDSAKEVEFEKRLKAFLGDSRYALYQRANDNAYQGAKAAVEANGLPADTAARVYDIKRSLDEEGQRLRADQTLAATDRAAQLAEARETSRAAVQQLLGEKGYNFYLQGTGSWMTNRVDQ
jgi:hypothetical protein